MVEGFRGFRIFRVLGFSVEGLGLLGFSDWATGPPFGAPVRRAVWHYILKP